MKKMSYVFKSFLRGLVLVVGVGVEFISPCV